jgi:hypothetical protein
MISNTDAPQQADTAQQQPSHSFKPRKLLALIAAVLFSAIMAGTGGYLLGMRNTQSIPMLAPTPTPTPMYIPPPPSGEIPAGAQPAPLKSTQDLPLIAAAVIEWIVKNQPSPGNPEISFLENDGIYAQGLVGDLGHAGGAGWFAAKIKGRWTMVHVGQGPPRCLDIAQYHLPKNWLLCY